ncbi:MAG: Lrp/AsnC family transcriptional regulator, partial [Actinomyces sp.]
GITALDAVTGVFHVTGDVDYLIRIEVADLDTYDHMLRVDLPAVAGGAHLTSYVVTSVLADEHP